MTEFELKTEVSKFYNGALTLDKAKRLYEFEFGYVPDVEEDIFDVVINENVLSYPDATDVITIKNLIFMKQLQESGVCNMFHSGTEVQKHLHVTSETAKELVLFYMEHYTDIYYPEQLL
jgi:hypothetical protein